MTRVVRLVAAMWMLGMGTSCRAPAPASARAVPAPTWSTVTAGPAVAMDTIRVRSGDDDMTAYLARPRGPGRYPAVIVLHANRLTEPYIASVTAMLGTAGFVALALDIFHFLPGNATWEDANGVSRDSVRLAIERGFREPRLIRNVQAGIDYLRTQSFVAPGGVAMLGFCGGGWNSLLVAAQSADVGAVVAFYAPVAMSDTQHRSPTELAEFIRVPVQFHYATRDQFVPSADVDRFGALLRAQGTVFERHDYDAEHGFFAWNRQGIFSLDAATAAWARVVGFLRANAGQPAAPRPTAPPAPTEGARGASNHLHLHG